MFKKFIIIFNFILIVSILSFGQTQLTIRGYAEGFYRPATGHMVAVADPISHPSICDTAEIILLNDTSYVVEFCTRVIIDTSGEGNYQIPLAYSGRSFIVGLRFRNTLHVFSIFAILMSGSSVYVDLTDPQNCCPQTKVIQGVAVAMSGEISSSISGVGYYDGVIEAQDFGDMENAVYFQDSGYVISDLTGDGITDSADYDLEFENVNLAGIDCYYAVCGLFNGVPQPVSKNFKIFPNPSIDNIHINFKNQFSLLNIKLINSFGEIIIQRNYFNDQDINLPCAFLKPGMYLVEIIDGEKHYSERVIVCN